MFSRLLWPDHRAGHVGADTAAVILAEAPHRRDEVTLVADVGTNAEIVLGDATRQFAAIGAAGEVTQQRDAPRKAEWPLPDMCCHAERNTIGHSESDSQFYAEHLVDALVRDDLREQRLRLSALVPAQQAADRVAIEECESNRRSSLESARCRIYAIE